VAGPTGSSWAALDDAVDDVFNNVIGNGVAAAAIVATAQARDTSWHPLQPADLQAFTSARPDTTSPTAAERWSTPGQPEEGCRDADAPMQAAALPRGESVMEGSPDMTGMNDGVGTPSPRHWLPKILITVTALAVLVLVVVLRIDITAGTLVVALIAALPWLPGVIEQVELTGFASVRLRKVQQQVADQERKLEGQREIIDKLVIYSMSWYIFKTLQQLYHRGGTGEEYLYRANMEPNLRFLRDHGYLEQFILGGMPDGENLIGKVKLTPVGEYFVQLREEMEARPARTAAEHLTPATAS
jgi:hypothetical protein